MNVTVIHIGWFDIGIALLPMALVIGVLYRWSAGPGQALYSIARMLVQLVVIGYFLVYIFETTHAWVICLVLTVMLLIASWICLNPVSDQRRRLYWRALLALAVGGGLTLATVTGGVLRLDPWFEPRYLVPLAGMVFANSMNTVSVAAERFAAETGTQGLAAARRVAFQAGMIPVINSMFAVGLVALPGMMTGQILSGVSPLVAVRYQIVVMCMLFAASGLSAALYLHLALRQRQSDR